MSVKKKPKVKRRVVLFASRPGYVFSGSVEQLVVDPKFLSIIGKRIRLVAEIL